MFFLLPDYLKHVIKQLKVMVGIYHEVSSWYS